MIAIPRKRVGYLNRPTPYERGRLGGFAALMNRPLAYARGSANGLRVWRRVAEGEIQNNRFSNGNHVVLLAFPADKGKIVVPVFLFGIGESEDCYSTSK